jgi:hypothetical protein
MTQRSVCSLVGCADEATIGRALLVGIDAGEVTDPARCARGEERLGTMLAATARRAELWGRKVRR